MTLQAHPTRRRRRETVQAARRIRRRRILALLAAGLVLGVGSIVTLAAWNDSEHGGATLTAGRFSLEGSADGVTYGNHGAEDPAQLIFDLDATELSPGTTVYALFSVRTGQDSMEGTLQMLSSPENDAGLGAHLNYGVSQISGTDCTAESFAAGQTVVPQGSALSEGPAEGDAQALAADQGDPVNYCFQISLPAETDDSAQGQGVTAEWEFRGTSS